MASLYVPPGRRFHVGPAKEDKCEPAESKIDTYHLSPEEIAAKYGPPNPKMSRLPRAINLREEKEMAAFQVYKPQKMTVLQAIEEREKVFIEADCASAVLKVLEESELILTQGLEKLIKDYHEECTKKMDRINGALEKIVIEV